MAYVTVDRYPTGSHEGVAERYCASVQFRILGPVEIETDDGRVLLDLL
jgi:hypothetical protein